MAKKRNLSWQKWQNNFPELLESFNDAYRDIQHPQAAMAPNIVLTVDKYGHRKKWAHLTATVFKDGMLHHKIPFIAQYDKEEPSATTIEVDYRNMARQFQYDDNAGRISFTNKLGLSKSWAEDFGLHMSNDWIKANNLDPEKHGFVRKKMFERLQSQSRSLEP